MEQPDPAPQDTQLKTSDGNTRGDTLYYQSIFKSIRSLFMLDTPILFIIFNRPDTTAQVFEAIRQAQPKRLYVSADGARSEKKDEVARCTASRAVLDQVDWDCAVYRRFHTQNQGCQEAVSGALTWFFEQEEAGIILEDDCLPSASFFPYCTDLLAHYKDDPQVFSINGSNFGYKLTNGDSYGFTRYMNMWGWATWRRSVLEVDYTLTSWQNKKSRWQKGYFLYTRLRQHYGHFELLWYRYWLQIFDRTLTMDTWDYQWMYRAFERKTHSIFPAQNLVTNIGFGEAATHTKNENYKTANVQRNNIDFPLQHPTKQVRDIRFERDFVQLIYANRPNLSRLQKTRQMLGILTRTIGLRR